MNTKLQTLDECLAPTRPQSLDECVTRNLERYFLDLEGDTPRTPVDELIDSQEEANFWNPAVQLRHRKKTSVPPRPDGAPNTFPEVVQVDGRAA